MEQDVVPAAQTNRDTTNWRYRLIDILREWLRTSGRSYMEALYPAEYVEQIERTQRALHNMEEAIGVMGRGVDMWGNLPASPLFFSTLTPQEMVQRSKEERGVHSGAERRFVFTQQDIDAAIGWYENYSSLLDTITLYVVDNNTPQQMGAVRLDDGLFLFRLNFLRTVAGRIFAHTSPQNPVPYNVTDTMLVLKFLDDVLLDVYRETAEEIKRGGATTAETTKSIMDTDTPLNNHRLYQRMAEKIGERLKPENINKTLAKFVSQYTDVIGSMKDGNVTAKRGATALRETTYDITNPQTERSVKEEIVASLIDPQQQPSTSLFQLIKERLGGSQKRMKLFFSSRPNRAELSQINNLNELLQYATLRLVRNSVDMVVYGLNVMDYFLRNPSFDKHNLRRYWMEIYEPSFSVDANKTRTYGIHSSRRIYIVDPQGTAAVTAPIENAPYPLTRDIWETTQSTSWFKEFFTEYNKTNAPIQTAGGRLNADAVNGILVSVGMYLKRMNPQDVNNKNKSKLIQVGDEYYSVEKIPSLWNDPEFLDELRVIGNVVGIPEQIIPEHPSKRFGEYKYRWGIHVQTDEAGRLRLVSFKPYRPVQMKKQPTADTMYKELSSQVISALQTLVAMNKVMVDDNGIVAINVQALEAMRNKPANQKEKYFAETILKVIETRFKNDVRDGMLYINPNEIAAGITNTTMVNRIVALSDALRKIYGNSLQSGAVNALFESYTLLPDTEKMSIQQVGKQVNDTIAGATSETNIGIERKRTVRQLLQPSYSVFTPTKEITPYQKQACNWTMLKEYAKQVLLRR